MNITSHKLENITINYQGDHTGLGQVDLGKISIVSMGPHYFPLGDLTRFGIYRIGDDLSDIEESTTRVAGWTKLIAGDRPFGSGATWIYFSVEKNESEIIMSANFENGKGEDPFAFVFFVKASEVRLNDKSYSKGSLLNYAGASSPLELICENEKVLITPKFKGPIQLIPLAGDESFWGADFLVAFEIHELDARYSWSVRKSI